MAAAVPYVPSPATAEVSKSGASSRFYSPLVRTIAKEEGISATELDNLSGSGLEGRVTKNDILEYVEKRKSGQVSAPAAIATQAPWPS